MEVQHVLHMNGGDGETSYASNSKVQKQVIIKAKPLVLQSIIDLLSTNSAQCLRIADLGCSIGPNTFLVIREIVEAIHQTCHQLNREMPELQLFLNDLPSNDFNAIFKTLPTFYEQLKKEKGEKLGSCFITGSPGSFYERLFPTNSIDFFHSSYSLHWLSQAPPTIEINKWNIYLASTSPASVVKAYLVQFQKDFSLFLSSRSEEITPGGRMLLTFIGRRCEEPFGNEGSMSFELLSNSLNDLVLEGLIEEAKMDSFNLPFYMPSSKELEDIVCTEGSFYLDHFEIFDANWGASDDDDNKYLKLDTFIRGQKQAKCVRAVLESLLAFHFGDSLIDTLFSRYTEYVSKYLSKEEGKLANFIISLRRK